MPGKNGAIHGKNKASLWGTQKGKIMSVKRSGQLALLCLFVLFSGAASAAIINPEVLIYNESGQEMWFYKEYDGLPDKTRDNSVKSKKLPKGRAMVVNRNTLLKFKSKLGYYTNDYFGKKCTDSGKTKFRQMNYGKWEYRKANSDEVKSSQNNVNKAKAAKDKICKLGANRACSATKDLLEVAEDKLADAKKADWRSTTLGKTCLDNRISKACLVVVVYDEKIDFYEDKGNFWGDACDKQAWKDFSYSANQFKEMIRDSSPLGEAFVESGESVVAGLKEKFNKVVGVLNGVSESACNKALDKLADTLKPKSVSSYLNTSCMEETFKGFSCAAPKYFGDLKKAPDNFKDMVNELSGHKDCKSQKKIPKAVCSVFKVVQAEVNRPVACMKEITENNVLKNLFSTGGSSSSSSGSMLNLSVPDEACYAAGESAFVKALDHLGVKTSKKKKADRIKKIAKAFLKIRKAQKAKNKFDKAGDAIKEQDIINEFTKAKMPNCYDML